MSKKLYHVHVYKVTKKAEITILAESEEEARKEAMIARRGLQFEQPDCKFIALSWEA